MPPITDIESLERYLRGGIPLARVMDIRVADYDGARLALSAPLAPNVNDKGCAFGGSLVSTLTLAAWGLVNLKLGEADLAAEVYVADTEISYLAPVYGEFVAEAAIAPEQSWDEFIATLRKFGKARTELVAEISAIDGGGIAARAKARFVAKRGTGE